MEQPTILRTTKIGGGFVKEDVIDYIDELNSKMEAMQKELDDAKNSSQSNAVPQQEIARYRTQIDSLQEKLNASNNALRSVRKENDELKKQLAGKGIPTGTANPQVQAELENAKKEIANLKSQLAAKTAQGGNQQLQNAFEAAKKEVATLKAALAEQKSAGAGKAPDNSAINAELAKAKQELSKLVAELKTKTDQLNAKTKESADKDAKITALAKESESAKKKDEEISKLNAEVSKLKADLSNPAAIMGNFFADAQEMVNKRKQEADADAEKTIKEAEEKAEKIVKEANEKADKTVKEANEKADKTIREYNEKTSKLNEMSETVRSILFSEIESVSSKLATLTTTINDITAQTSDKVDEAKAIMNEARKAVETNDSKAFIKPVENINKPASASKATAPAAPKPVAEVPKQKPADTVKPVAPAMSGMDDIVIKPVASSPKPAVTQTPPPKPAPAVKNEPPKKKPINNFGFDMEALLKAAEAEASKTEE
ncbi:MAG: hypothetical protein K2K91_11580 [Ruminococcus sp.]|nr:hypothetical protein [Ruminococcus sp.]